MNRYVILREPTGQHLPMGLAIEREHDITIIALDEFGLPKRVSEPYRVVQRDLSSVEYVPGSEGYFEQVLLELQRVASLGKRGTVEDVDRDTLIELYNDQVVKPRVAAPRVYETQPPLKATSIEPRWEPSEESNECYEGFPRVAA